MTPVGEWASRVACTWFWVRTCQIATCPVTPVNPRKTRRRPHDVRGRTSKTALRSKWSRKSPCSAHALHPSQRAEHDVWVLTQSSQRNRLVGCLRVRQRLSESSPRHSPACFEQLEAQGTYHAQVDEGVGEALNPETNGPVLQVRDAGLGHRIVIVVDDAIEILRNDVRDVKKFLVIELSVARETRQCD